MVTQIRAAVLAILSILVGAGWVPADVAELIRANADAILAGVFAAWALTAGLRSRKERKA
jgi:uncharacterized membrane protein YccC